MSMSLQMHMDEMKLEHERGRRSGLSVEFPEITIFHRRKARTFLLSCSMQEVSFVSSKQALFEQPIAFFLAAWAEREKNCLCLNTIMIL